MKKYKLNGETFIHNVFRYLSWLLIDKILLKTNITPNQITIFRSFLMVVSFLFFINLNFYYILGFFLFQFAEMLDSTDGDLARIKNLKSKIGIFLEIFFDSIISPVWGLLGLVFAYISYKIDGNFIYFILWGLIGFSVNLEKSFYIHFRGCNQGFEEAKHGHIYFGFRGENFKTKIKNFIIVSKIWENQWLIFGGLIYVIFKINLFLYIWIWLLFLNQMHWIRLAYKGYLDAKNNT